MNEFQQYFGFYYFMGIALDINQVNDQLVAVMLGVPDGFEIIFKPVEEGSFRLQGGPLDGSVVTFTRNASGEVIGLNAGQFELAKISQAKLKTVPIAKRLPAPAVELTLAKQARFDELLQSCLAQSGGDWIAYDLPYPKQEFVQYVSAQDILIFHGSNNAEIATFEPVRTSMELHDESGRGNLQAIYGTHEGLWSMFFAVVDRPRLKGSIRNGVEYFRNQGGERLSLYNFSINQEQLAERPYTQGALYFLPRDTFIQLKLTEDSYANEWASEQPVQPYAKLLIQPEDFPFLEQIDGHDDSELLHLQAISDAIRAAATAATLNGDRFEITLPSAVEVLEQLREYVSLQETMMPAAKFEVKERSDDLKLVITSLPPAVQQLFRKSYDELLRV